MGLLTRESVEVPCTVEVSHTFDSLHAHVTLGDGVLIEPGDEVRVHGDPVDVAFGECATVERRATVVRASQLERLWTRLVGRLELMELAEFSFSSGRRL